MPTNFNPFAYSSFKVRGYRMEDKPRNNVELSGAKSDGTRETITFNPGDERFCQVWASIYKLARNNQINLMQKWSPSYLSETLFGGKAATVQAQKPSSISLTSGAQQRRKAGGISNTILTGPLGLSMLNKSTQKRLLGT